jgi:long-subunit acyl-CoA synthetase (AMP-forming)
VADLGALRMGAVVVPIYRTNAPEACVHALAHSGAEALLGADAGQLAEVGQVREARASPPASSRPRCASGSISQAVVFGDRRSHLVAVLTPDPSTLPELAQRTGVEPDPVEMARDARVHAVLQHEVDEVNRRLAHIEPVKRFRLLDRYGEVFAALYD